MSLKDKFNNFIDYFTEDGEEVEVHEIKAAGGGNSTSSTATADSSSNFSTSTD